MTLFRRVATAQFCRFPIQKHSRHHCSVSVPERIVCIFVYDGMRFNRVFISIRFR